MHSGSVVKTAQTLAEEGRLWGGWRVGIGASPRLVAMVAMKVAGRINEGILRQLVIDEVVWRSSVTSSWRRRERKRGERR